MAEPNKAPGILDWTGFPGYAVKRLGQGGGAWDQDLSDEEKLRAEMYRKQKEQDAAPAIPGLTINGMPASKEQIESMGRSIAAPAAGGYVGGKTTPPLITGGSVAGAEKELGRPLTEEEKGYYSPKFEMPEQVAAGAPGLSPAPKAAANSTPIQPAIPESIWDYGTGQKTTKALRDDALRRNYQMSGIENYTRFLSNGAGQASPEIMRLAAQTFPGYQRAMESGLDFDKNMSQQDITKMLGIGELGIRQQGTDVQRQLADVAKSAEEYKQSGARIPEAALGTSLGRGDPVDVAARQYQAVKNITSGKPWDTSSPIMGDEELPSFVSSIFDKNQLQSTAAAGKDFPAAQGAARENVIRQLMALAPSQRAKLLEKKGIVGQRMKSIYGDKPSNYDAGTGVFGWASHPSLKSDETNERNAFMRQLYGR